MNRDDLIDAIEAARPKLGADVTLPDADTVARFVHAATTRDGGRILKQARRDATRQERGFLALLRWTLGGAGFNLGTVMVARWDLGEEYDGAESLAVLCAVLLRGGSPTIARWRDALYG